MIAQEKVLQIKLPLPGKTQSAHKKAINKDFNENQLLMNKVLNDIMLLDYYSGKQLEKEVEKILIKNMVKYKSQPNGSQKFPDFHVWLGNKKFNLECKSSKGKKPTWNQSYPRNNSLYIFSTSSKKYRGTYLFMGDNYWEKEVREHFIEVVLPMVKAQQLAINNAAKVKFGKDLPFTYYNREMWQDRRSPINDSKKRIQEVYDYFYKELK